MKAMEANTIVDENGERGDGGHHVGGRGGEQDVERGGQLGGVLRQHGVGDVLVGGGGGEGCG